MGINEFQCKPSYFMDFFCAWYRWYFLTHDSRIVRLLRQLSIFTFHCIYLVHPIAKACTQKETKYPQRIPSYWHFTILPIRCVYINCFEWINSANIKRNKTHTHTHKKIRRPKTKKIQRKLYKHTECVCKVNKNMASE